MAIDFFDPKDIQRIYELEDSEVQAYVAKLKNKLERYLLGISKDITKKGADIQLRELITQLDKLSVASLPEDILAEVNKVTTLYQSRINTLEEAFARVADATKIFNAKDSETITRLIGYDQANILTTIDGTFNEFKQITFRGRISGQLPDLAQTGADILDGFESKLPAELNTQLAAFQRSVSMSKADELELTHFLYAGGTIKTSRQFCIERANKIFTLEETQSWDNEQDLPVIPYLGGYNCRHSMVFMTKDKAVENGWTE